MAQPSTEIKTYRDRVTTFLDAANSLSSVLAPIEGAGENDAQRAAFFSAWIDEQEAYDITSVELFASATTLRDLETWFENELATLAKMRI